MSLFFLSSSVLLRWKVRCAPYGELYKKMLFIFVLYCLVADIQRPVLYARRFSLSLFSSICYKMCLRLCIVLPFGQKKPTQWTSIAATSSSSSFESRKDASDVMTGQVSSHTQNLTTPRTKTMAAADDDDDEQTSSRAPPYYRRKPRRARASATVHCTARRLYQSTCMCIREYYSLLFIGRRRIVAVVDYRVAYI